MQLGKSATVGSCVNLSGTVAYQRRRSSRTRMKLYVASSFGGNADYSTVHLSGRHDLGEDSLTIYKNQLGHPQVVKASPEVHEYSRNAIAARKTFGETAAIVAYGHKLRATEGRSGGLNRGTPGWEKVWDSSAARNGITVEEARVLLEKNRHLKFRTADDHAILGIRLHPDGTMEQKWLSSLEPVFHV